MSLWKVIRKYRKIRNLTQEEMAGRLGVTAPAVNKWENENSHPDITLLSFREDLTVEEINGIVREADLKLKTGSYNAAFRWAKKKLEEYPNCEQLILNLAVIFDAQRMVQEIPNEAEYDKYLCSLYVRALGSEDEAIRVRAADSLVEFYNRIRIGKGSWRKFLLKRDGYRKPIRRMKNFCFRITRGQVRNCMECILLQYKTMT